MPKFDRLRNIRKFVVPSTELLAVPESVRDKAVTTAGQARRLWGSVLKWAEGAPVNLG